MSPEEAMTFQRIFTSYFNPEWFEDFEALVACGQEEANETGTKEQQIACLPEEKIGLDGKPLDEVDIYDPFQGAKAWFWSFWNLVKMDCAKRHIILEKDQVMALCKSLIPFPDVWKELIEQDDDFRMFQRMKLHQEQERKIEKAPKQQQIEMRRLQKLQRIIERNLIISGDQNTQTHRLAKPFNDELESIIQEMEAEGLYATPKEIALTIKESYPHIPGKMLLLLNQYKIRLRVIKGQIKPKKKTEPKTTETQVIHIKGFEIDPEKNVLVFQEKDYVIGFKGLNQAFDTLISIEMYSPMDFYGELKTLLNKIHEHCQKAGVLKGFLKLVYKLQEHYKNTWDREDKSEKGIKIGLTYSALGLKHAEIAESMPTDFRFVGK